MLEMGVEVEEFKNALLSYDIEQLSHLNLSSLLPSRATYCIHVSVSLFGYLGAMPSN